MNTDREPQVLSYFPGCSLHSTAGEYDDSTQAVCKALGITLQELKDWNCCGSTSAHSTNAELARLLPLRNLEIAERAGLDVMVPCAACYGRSKAAQMAAKKAPDLEEHAFYTGQVEVHHILDVLAEPKVLAAIKGKITRRLTDLKAVCYYGCLTTRPPKVTGATDYENPESMDHLVEATDATAIPWSFKTDCCGASLTLTRPDVVIHLTNRLLEMAEEAGADCIVVACSMCHANLDARQKQTPFGSRRSMPIFYISELLGLAMGIPEASRWWKKHLTDPQTLLNAKSLM